MQTEDRALVHAAKLHDVCAELVGLQAAARTILQRIIRPDDILRRLRRAAGQLLLPEIEAGQMVAVKDDDNRLIVGGQRQANPQQQEP